MARNDQRGPQQDERSDGLREKMISVNRVTKVVKGGRILGFAALTVVGLRKLQVTGRPRQRLLQIGNRLPLAGSREAVV